MSVFRTKHNRENPFVQINKGALWNPNLSLKAIGLWARCLSRPDDWKFSIKELASKGIEGPRAIYSAVDELIEHGYALKLKHYEKEETGEFKGGGVEYIIFEFPASDQEKADCIDEFKKSFRHCGFGDLRRGDLQNSTLLINTSKENEKEQIPTVCTPAPVASDSNTFSVVKKKDFDGLEFDVSLQEVFKQSILQRKSWTSQEIEEAFTILRDYDAPIRDWFHFVEGTIKNRRNVRKGAELSKMQNKGKKPCQTQESNRSESYSDTLSEKDTKVYVSMASVLKKMQAEGSLDG